MISHALWQRQFGGNPDVLGKTIRLDEDAYTIVGVMPPDFRHPGRTVNGDVDIWLAAGFHANPFPNPPTRAQRYLPGILGRLKRGITVAQAQARLDALTTRLRAAYPKDYPAEVQWSLRVDPVQENLTGKVRAMLLVLLASVGFVLLMVCVNLATLTMGRSSARVREMAIRQALGASRRRLVQQLLTESTLVSLAGGAAALLALTLLKPALLAIMPADLPRLAEVRYDSPLLAMALLLSLATGILFGLTPALDASACDPNTDLKEGGRSGASRRQNRFRSVLVSAEIALSVVLSIGAGLLIRSFYDMLRVSPGMDPRNVVLARIWIPVPNNPKLNRYLSPAQREVLIRELLRRAGSLPDVERAAMASGSAIPFLANVRNPLAFTLPDLPGERHTRSAEFAAVSPDYLRVLKAPLLGGRFFSDADSAASPRVVVVDEAFVRRYLPGAPAVGRRLLTGFPPQEREIVGVVGDLRGDGLDAPALPHVYAPIYQNSNFELALFLRTAHDAPALPDAVGRIVHAVDPELPVYGVRTMPDLLSASMQRRRFSLWLMSAMAALALLLAAIGIYGLMSLAVSQRTHEFGIRVALGASRWDVLAAAVRPGMALALIGMAAGVMCAAGAMRLMSSLLFGVSPNDPLTFAAVPVVLGIVALAACLVPARRAARISPLQAMKH